MAPTFVLDSTSIVWFNITDHIGCVGIKLYEQLRKTRSEAIVRETFHQRDAFHMPDGQEQEVRDKIFASQLGKEITCKFPSRWTCAEVQPWLYGYDAYKEADAALAAGASEAR
jgi:salicylate hydroxylase